MAAENGYAGTGSDDDTHVKEGQSLVRPLAEDNAAPFSPPVDPISDPAAGLDERTASGRLEPTHQVTDNATDLDSHQVYDEGLSGAAEASEPNAGNAVVDYHPERDQRREDIAGTDQDGQHSAM